MSEDEAKKKPRMVIYPEQRARVLAILQGLLASGRYSQDNFHLAIREAIELDKRLNKALLREDQL